MTKDLLKTDFQRGDFIPHSQLNLLARMAGRGEARPAAFVDGTGSYSRSLPSQSEEVVFRPNAAVVPYAVMETTGTEVIGGGMSVALLTRQYQAGDPRKALVINGHWTVGANEFGRGVLATQTPAIIWGAGAAGASVGPSHASWSLSTGHPGFRMIGNGPVANTIIAVREFAPTVCKAIFKAAMSSGDATITVDNVVAMSGLDPVANAAAELTVQNTLAWEAVNNDKCSIRWNESENQWEFITVAGIVENVIVGWRYDTASNKFQKKTLNVHTVASGGLSAWTDVFTATTVTVHTDLQVDGANKEVEEKTTELTVLEKAVESGWVVWHTGTPCP